MGHINQIISPRAIALRALLLAAPLVSSLQVTPNSPCSKVCVDSTILDLSDPNSSNTRNSDIVCADADLGSPKGTKWKDCMTCLQTSTFSQGSENDQAWFLYNLRYSLSYCVFGFPNATGVADTPCRTSFACQNLQGSLEHGVLDPTKTTTYSYCSVPDHLGEGEPAKSHLEYERCTQCVAAERKTLKLVNYLTALEAGCQQQPKLGKTLALNDTIFLDGRITIVDPTTVLAPAAPSSGLPTNTIVGIVVAGLAAIIIASAVSFVCYRKRVNRRKRADIEAKYYAGGGASRHKHNSSLSFQCQTHMTSPRFWPGADGNALSPVNEMGDAEQKIDTSVEHDASWDQPHQPQGASFPLTNRSANNLNNSASSLPLHQITTSVPPAAPLNTFTSPSSASGGYNHSPSESGAGNMSAVSARSTTALLPSSYRPYVPAEHGVHGSPQFSMNSTFSSPVSGTTASPLLKNQTWQQQQQQQNKETPKQHRVKNFSTPLVVGAGGGASSSTSEGNVPPPPPGPPPPKAPRLALPKMPNRKQQPPVVSGSPVESTEIKTAFSEPPSK
ncbi:hypothetical protein V8F06_001179 [Rhypophila decipiens]